MKEITHKIKVLDIKYKEQLFFIILRIYKIFFFHIANWVTFWF